MAQLQINFGFLETHAGDSDIAIEQSFPEEAANELAAVESFNKHLYRPNTYLHKWLARRSGTCFRHILKQLVNDGRRRSFYEAGGLEGTVILDPMMGGGTIVHEAIRLGASVIGVDIDPIPVLQAKATLEPPQVSHKVSVFRHFLKALRRDLGTYFRTRCPVCDGGAEVQFTLYGLRRHCGCGEATFVDSLVLREGREGDQVLICPECWGVYYRRGHSCETLRPRLLEKSLRVCARCRLPFRDLVEEPFNERYTPLAIVGQCARHGQFYKAPQSLDITLMKQAKAAAGEIDFPDPLLRIDPGPKSKDLRRRGVGSFHDLFTPRQQLYIARAVAALAGLERKDRLWLSLLVSTSLEFNSLLCGYKGAGRRRAGAIRHVFSHHAYSFPYTALENNPVLSLRTSGTLERLFYDRVVKAGLWAQAPVERRVCAGRVQKVPIVGEQDYGSAVDSVREISEGPRRFLILQADARTLKLPSESVDYVVTDPPYYDSVQYSDLSKFFRGWLAMLETQPKSVVPEFRMGNGEIFLSFFS